MVLLESLSATVFHSTSLRALNKILTDNKFHLSSSLGTPSDADVNKPWYHFFMSLSNVKNSGYDIGNNLEVKLVLYGDKLNSNYP